MMITLTYWPIYWLMIKLLIIALIATIVGLGLGLGHVYAETKNNLNVPVAGSVDTAATNGGNSTPTLLFAYGQSASSVNLFYLYANARFWHTGPLLQDQKSKTWNNSKGGVTPLIYTSGFGDKAATQSKFRYASPTTLATYYTSWWPGTPSAPGSCYNFWNSGNSC